MQLASQQRQQPFFKTNTSSATGSSSYFLNFNTNTNNRNGNQSQTGSRTNSASATSFFPPHSTVSRQKDKETERETTQTTERLSALHNKLHQEAEKIRKWKTKTDLELNDKGKKLHDANMTIESQRKSIVELQLQNEKLSSKLQEELAGHTELDHKATATRELCNVLKDQVFRIDEAVTAGERDREELHFTEKQHLEQFQELVVKFQELEIQHSTKYNEMKDKLQKQQERHVIYATDVTQCIEEKEKQIALLSDEKAEKEIKISELVKDLGENREHLEVTKNEEAVLKDRLKESEGIITSKDIQLKSANEILTYTQDENKKLMTDVCERDRALVQFREEKLQLEHVLQDKENQDKLKDANFHANISSLQNELDMYRIRIKELSSKIDELTLELQERKNDCESRKAEKDVLQKEIENLTSSNEELLAYQEELVRSLQELKAEKDCLLENTSGLAEREKTLTLAEESSKKYINELEGKSKMLEADMEKNLDSLAQKEELVTALQAELEESKREAGNMNTKIEKLENLLREESVNQDNMSSDLEEVKEERVKLTKELDHANKEIKNLKQDMKALKKTEAELKKEVSKSTEQKQKLENEVMQLKEQLEEKTEEIGETLDMEMNTTKSLREELSSKEKELNSLENKTKTMQNQVTTKSKQIKDLQQEIKTMKSNALAQTKKTKSLEKKNETLETEMEQTKSEKEEMEKEIDTLKEKMSENQEQSENRVNEVEKVKVEMEKSIKRTATLEAEVKKLTEAKKKALKEKKESQDCFDRERADLCSTLENYKAENERIVAQKERDLDEFKHSKQTEVEEQKKQIRELEEELKNLTKSRIDAENATAQAINQKDSEIDTLKKKIQEMDMNASETISKGYVAETPTRTQLVPSTPKTPRSILRQTDKPTKKRRVAFSSDHDVTYSSDEDEKNFKVFKTNTTKVVKSKSPGSTIPTKVVRPNVRHSPGPVSQPAVIAKKATQSLTKNKKKNEMKGLHNEMEQFKELFPSLSTDMSEKKDAGKAKKTPFKSRITKISPRKTEVDVDWFDNDAFFGFDG